MFVLYKYKLQNGVLRKKSNIIEPPGYYFTVKNIVTSLKSNYFTSNYLL